MESTKQKTSESIEDYLETILLLAKDEGSVRSIDVVRELHFSKPSVSVAVKNLKNQGYINVDEKGYITLTETGEKIAKTVLERHTIISDWLISLGVDEKTALEDACRMEHTMSVKSFKAIKKHIKDYEK